MGQLGGVVGAVGWGRGKKQEEERGGDKMEESRGIGQKAKTVHMGVRRDERRDRNFFSINGGAKSA